MLYLSKLKVCFILGNYAQKQLEMLQFVFFFFVPISFTILFISKITMIYIDRFIYKIFSLTADKINSSLYKYDVNWKEDYFPYESYNLSFYHVAYYLEKEFTAEPFRTIIFLLVISVNWRSCILFPLIILQYCIKNSDRITCNF